MATRERQKAIARKEARKNGPVLASLRGAKMSARKMRIIADLVRGEAVGDALVQLAFQRRAAAKPLRILLDSAVANAAEKGLNVDKLVVEEIQIHKGAMGRRYMPRAHGRATRIRKQSAHVDVSLIEAT
jgi:large subunit ribosomal protein L22